MRGTTSANDHQELIDQEGDEKNIEERQQGEAGKRGEKWCRQQPWHFFLRFATRIDSATSVMHARLLH
jgi:hypothetical protein